MPEAVYPIYVAAPPIKQSTHSFFAPLRLWWEKTISSFLKAQGCKIAKVPEWTVINDLGLNEERISLTVYVSISEKGSGPEES